MSSNRWIEYLGGIITVRVWGPYPEKIINLALSRGIYLSDVERDGEYLSFSIRRNAIKPLENLGEEFGYEIEILKKQGLPFYSRVLRERWMLIAGGFIFVLALYILSSFVWYLEIRGTVEVKPTQVAESVARHGLKRWAFKGGLDKTRIEEGILQDIPQLFYAQVDIKGVKAVVKVVEKIFPEEEMSGPCHVVAGRGGIIEEMMVLDGNPLVKIGDTVGAGNILISGAVTTESGESEGIVPVTNLVRARGMVKARVWYEGYGEAPLMKEIITLTGKRTEGITIEYPGGKWWLKSPDQRVTSFWVEKKTYEVGSPWGKVALTREVRSETLKSTEEVSSAKALETATNQAMENLRKLTGQAERVINTQVRKISSPSEQLIRVKVEAEVLEDIGKIQPINIEQEWPQTY
ncbi:MAG: sporulation protein YqfD [Syntrophomonadaceae bacterium]|nr:sporulation protein YqfD [Syntrophomonadaceae bacterium]